MITTVLPLENGNQDLIKSEHINVSSFNCVAYQHTLA